jgi:hypothetical protein
VGWEDSEVVGMSGDEEAEPSSGKHSQWQYMYVIFCFVFLTARPMPYDQLYMHI